MKLQVDYFFLIVSLFGVTIAIAASLFIYTTLFAGINANPTFAACANCVAALSKGSQALSVFPNAIVIIFILAALASVISAAFVDTHPIFLVLIIIILPVEVFVSSIFHDAFFDLMNNSFLGSALSGYPSLFLLFEYLPYIALVLVIIIAIITFTKS